MAGLMGAFLKSLIFNIVFYTYTLFICLFLSFTFILPRKLAYYCVRFFYFQAIALIERVFLGLRYRVTGRENIPQGSYILALKHYSIYETLKVPVIFGDVAIILKQELSKIPFWGWYTTKLGNIPIDRSGRKKALTSLIAGGKRVIDQGRPILIFPQGTRVSPSDTTAEKPYKVGIAKIAETLNLPVVPVALNSGAFWPKNAFMVKSGVVDFKILPIIPAGLTAEETLKRLEEVMEPESAVLIANADIRKGTSGLTKFIIFLVVLWCAWCQLIAYTVRERMVMMPKNISSPYQPSVGGFPTVHVSWPQVTVTNDTGTITMPLAKAKVWPVPMGHVALSAPQGFTLETLRDGNKINFTADRFAMTYSLPAFWTPQDSWSVNLKSIAAASGTTVLDGKGDIAIPLEDHPVNGTLNVDLAGYDELLSKLGDQGLVDQDKLRMAKSLMDAMASSAGQANGAIKVPLSVRDDVVYLSVVRLFSLSELRSPAGGPGLPPQKIHSDGSATDSPQAPVPQMPIQGSPTEQ